MEREAYDAMYHLEDEFWWYAGMRALTSVLLADIELTADGPRVLDAGCGTGANLTHFASLGSLTGIDIDAGALAYCRQRHIEALVQGSVTSLPFASSSFDLLYCFEVLYHAQAVADVAALREFWRLLTPGGYCVIRLPAYQWLMSAHDVAVHMQHRYTAGEVRAKALSAGFVVERITHLNTVLLPLAILRRLVTKLSGEGKSDVQPVWLPLNAALRWLLSLERHFIKHWNLPVGLSVCAVLRKPPDAGA